MTITSGEMYATVRSWARIEQAGAAGHFDAAIACSCKDRPADARRANAEFLRKYLAAGMVQEPHLHRAVRTIKHLEARS